MQILFQNSFKLHSHISWFSSALGSLIYCQNTSTEALMDGGGYRMWEWSKKDSGPSGEWMMKLNQMHFTCYSNKPFSRPESEMETLCLLLDSAHTDEIHKQRGRELGSGYSPHHHSISSPVERTKPKLNFSDLFWPSPLEAACLVFKSSFYIAY